MKDCLVLEGKTLESLGNVNWPRQLDNLSVQNGTPLHVTFENLQNLQTFSLRDTPLTSFNIRFPHHLHRLCLKNVGITSLEGLQFGPELTGIDLSGNPIESINEFVWPKHLRLLRLCSTEIKSIDQAR